MGYRIIYGNGKEERSKPKSRRIWMTGFWFGVLMIITAFFWPEGKALLQRILLPGDPQQTVQAAAALIADLRGGTDLSCAVTAFCQSIIGYEAGY